MESSNFSTAMRNAYITAGPEVAQDQHFLQALGLLDLAVPALDESLANGVCFFGPSI